MDPADGPDAGLGRDGPDAGDGPPPGPAVSHRHARSTPREPALDLFNKPLNRWWTVLAGALGCAGGSGVVGSWVFGVFVKQISKDFGWERSVTTAGIFFFYLFYGIGCLALGDMMARWGVRKCALLFVLVFVTAMGMIGLLPNSPALFCLVYSVTGFFGAAATALPYSVAIAGWFNKRRGVALALVVGGTGVSAMFISTYANWLLSHYGWRGGYIGVALFCAVVALPGLVFFFRMPPSAPHRGLVTSWPAILASRPLWLMSVPLFLVSVAVYGVTTNLAPLFTDRGMTMATAAGLLGLLGGASAVSRLATGAFLDRVHVRLVSVAVFLLVAAGIALVGWGPSGATTAVGVIAIGTGLGAEAGIMGFAVSRYFDAEALARATGVVFAGCAWGGGVGNSVGSLSFDLTGSYGAALGVYIGLALVSAAVISRLGPYETAAPPSPRPSLQPVPRAGEVARPSSL